MRADKPSFPYGVHSHEIGFHRRNESLLAMRATEVAGVDVKDAKAGDANKDHGAPQRDEKSSFPNLQIEEGAHQDEGKGRNDEEKTNDEFDHHQRLVVFSLGESGNEIILGLSLVLGGVKEAPAQKLVNGNPERFA